jgi:hypothetical protein
MDAYDLSSHLRRNIYCSKKDNNPIESSSSSQPTTLNVVGHSTTLAAASIPHDDGDNFFPSDNEDDDVSVPDDDVSVSEAISCDGEPNKSVGPRAACASPCSSASDNSYIGGDSSSVCSSSTTNSNPHLPYSDSDNGDSVSEADDEYEFYNDTTFPSGVDDVVHVALASLCHKIKAPQYAYDDILRWAQHSQALGYSFSSEAPLYRTFISDLKK